MVERVGFAALIGRGNFARENMEKKDEFYLPEEIVEWVELKKSEYLSRLITYMDSDDFGFESFFEFDPFVPGTIEYPDRTFEFTEEGHQLKTFIRTYAQEKFFHQVVIGVLIPDLKSDSVVFVPILTFVTKKDELVSMFSNGQGKGPTLN